MIDKKFWPFDTPQSDKLSEEALRDIAFLESARREGHQSFVEGGIVLGALSTSGREGNIVRRGGNGRYWEIVLIEKEARVASRYIDGFAPADDAVLSWLRGDEVASVLKRIEGAIVAKPGERGW